MTVAQFLVSYPCPVASEAIYNWGPFSGLKAPEKFFELCLHFIRWAHVAPISLCRDGSLQRIFYSFKYIYLQSASKIMVHLKALYIWSFFE